MRYLSAGLSGSMKRMTGGADSVSVAKTPPCSWIPKPVSGSPLRKTSLVSTWKTCPPGPTELDTRDTGTQKGRRKKKGKVEEGKWKRRAPTETTMSHFSETSGVDDARVLEKKVKYGVCMTARKQLPKRS